MGKLRDLQPEEILVKKFKDLFADIQRKNAEANPTGDDEMTFESFVENFDETDRFTRRLFEFVIKETRCRRRQQRQPASHPYVRPGSGLNRAMHMSNIYANYRYTLAPTSYDLTNAVSNETMSSEQESPLGDWVRLPTSLTVDLGTGEHTVGNASAE
eukprot:comp1316_c0_seq1/m.365 comp1316_c0_seq1/g.365  ORF comp1316_c0_seq1/g.365 comp1316_c0_seq1/m.365 type:complete len:157 (-) comp1316_c0_seq1:56-526(-)